MAHSLTRTQQVQTEIHQQRTCRLLGRAVQAGALALEHGAVVVGGGAAAVEDESLAAAGGVRVRVPLQLGVAEAGALLLGRSGALVAARLGSPPAARDFTVPATVEVVAVALATAVDKLAAATDDGIVVPAVHPSPARPGVRQHAADVANLRGLLLQAATAHAQTGKCVGPRLQYVLWGRPARRDARGQRGEVGPRVWTVGRAERSAARCRRVVVEAHDVAAARADLLGLLADIWRRGEGGGAVARAAALGQREEVVEVAAAAAVHERHAGADVGVVVEPQTFGAAGARVVGQQARVLVLVFRHLLTRSLRHRCRTRRHATRVSGAGVHVVPHPDVIWYRGIGCT